MQKPPLDPDVADAAPTAPALTGYDERHRVTYLRLLDAETNGADWKRLRGSCCTLIRTASLIAPAAPGKSTSPAPTG